MVVVSDDGGGVGGGGHGGHGGHSDVGVAVVVDACVRTHPIQNKTDNYV
jgi:hypothetical protein